MNNKRTLNKRNKILKLLNILLVLSLVLTSGILEPGIALANQSDNDDLLAISQDSDTSDDSILNNEIEELSVNDQFDIRLLEIQPGNSFTLGGGETGEVIIEVTVNDQTYKVLIEKVSMPEFIGKTEQINGYYDIVVIGRNTQNIDKSSLYRDYSGINFDGKEHDEGKGTIADTSNAMVPNGNYVENDITIRKAKEIIEFIKSGQLFVMNNEIFSKISNASSSNLNTYFNTEEVKSKKNVTMYSNENEFDLESIISRYLEEDIKKKPQFKIINTPTSDSGNNGNVSNRDLRFNVLIPEGVNEASLKLYLDINGDGLFNDKEIYYIDQKVSSQNNYEFTYNIGNDFVGWLDWKVELEQNGIKSYEIGNLILKSVNSDKKVIRVLQVKPDKDGNKDRTTLVLSENEQFKNLIKNLDYDIKITTISSDEFSSRAGNANHSNPLILNGNYDMVIIGFADNYGKADIKTDSALSELENFIASGQSVMFTHDSMALRMESEKASVQLTKRFRDFLGQSRFIDFLSDNKETVECGEYICTKDIYKTYDAETKEYVDRLIPHIRTESNIYGHSLLGRAGYAKDRVVTKVYLTNSGMITNYPYSLNSTIDVASTHHQWYQLNLEDEDVVPWYNLIETNATQQYNQYDSRNNYYTYSKGNITYSGTGHSDQYPEDELKLFVNTIIKAERGANHAPTITSSLADGEQVTQIPGGLDYKFTIKVSDIDGDPVNAIVKAVVGNEERTLGKFEKVDQGKVLELTLKREFVGQENSILIKVEADDIQGAKATSKEYKLQSNMEAQLVVENPMLTGLIGDTIVATIEYEKVNETSNAKITDIEFGELSYNSNVLTLTESESQEQKGQYVIVPKTTLNNEELSGTVKYKVNGQLSEKPFKIFVTSRAAEVNLRITDTNGTLINYIDVYAKIYGSDSIKIDNGSYTFKGSEKVRLISGVDHQLSLELPNNYELTKVSIKELKEDKQVDKLKESTIEQGVINIPTFNVSYDKPYVEIDLQLRTDLKGEIRILEIEPADKFKLSKTEGLDVTGTEIIYEKVDNTSDKEYKIIVDHITMPEFIGSVEKINGKYDIIVIGRYVHDWSKSDPKNQKKYADYNFTRSDEWEENDITNRKAKEIIEFINSGQLVYLDKQILNDNISDTKLYRNFKKVSASNLITSKSISELNLNDIISYYTTEFSDQNKRLKLQAIDATPSDITTNTDLPDGLAANRNRKMYIKTLSNIASSETYSLNLYLDLDGDGLFSDDEITATKTGLSTSEEFLELDYSIHPDFIGRLEWKLEISKGNSESPIKTYVTGVMNFHRLPEKEKKKIRVLQISKDNKFMWDDDETGDFGKLKYEVLDLSVNKKFNDLLDSIELKDYDISIQIIDSTTFNNIMKASINENELVFNSDLSEGDWNKINWYEFTQEELIAIKQLNGYYDMIILGFADSYENAVEKEGITVIEEFIKTGQGLMLTHDTLVYSQGNVEDLKCGDEEDGTEESINLMLCTFRSLAGQARYSGLSTDLNENTIMYDEDQPSIDSISNNKKLSEVLFSGGSLTAIKNAITDQSGNLSTLSTKVYEINSALITSYPFNLVPDEASTLSIRRTHGQYLQLNLEDEAVIPWYTYTEYNVAKNPGDGSYDVKNEVNPYDVRNNYYTYSRENITYSGTGEQKRERSEYPTSELKLFVNTIIKAERGANHAPTVEVRNLSEGMLISKYQENLNFTVIPTDMDLDQMKLTITVEGCKQNGCSSTDIGLIDKDYIRKNGESVNISLNIKDKLSKYETIKVTVKATDSHGADSKTVSYNLKITEDRLLTFSSDPGNYLIGDTATVKVNVNSNGTQAFKGEYEITEFPSKLDPQASLKHTFNLVDQTSPELNFSFKVIGDPTVQVNNTSTFNLLGEYTYCLGSAENNCANIEGSYESFINVKRGRITLKFESNITELFLKYEVKVQLLQGDKVITEKLIDSSNEVIFDTVSTGTYYIKLIPSEELVADYRLEKNSKTLPWDTKYEIHVNYENNHVIETFSINQVPFNLVHGLFKSQTNQAINIVESTSSNLTEIDGETLVNFGATFTTKNNTDHVKLRVSEKFNNFSEKSIQVFMVERNGEALSLKPLAGVKIQEDSDTNQLSSKIYNINLPDLSEPTDILIFYTALTPNEEISLITNTITVGATIKDVSIGVKKNSEDEKESNSYLPNLF